MAPAVTWLATMLTPALGATVAGMVASAVVQIGGSILIGAVARKFAPKPSTPDFVRELQRDSELPPYRFAYGQTRVWGSWAPREVKGEYIYGCLILNSRPSHAVDAVLLDNRPVTLSGDRYDFSASGGAVATNAPFTGHFKCWVGLGDQTAPPAQILEEAGDIFQATDAWRGRTVLWVRIKAGDNDERQDRWPSAPPVIACDGRWSKLWDPRLPAQGADNPASWTFSRNWALACLDVLRQNPIERYRLSNLLMQTFIDAADAADDSMGRKSGGPEPRYRADGVVIFEGSELLDQLDPLLAAGAGQWTRVGGRLGLVPGVWRAPVVTIDDVLAPEMEFERWVEGKTLPNVIRAKYVSVDRGYEMADLPPFYPPGALAEDGGIERGADLDLPFVTSATQAMRLQRIRGLRSRCQKGWSGTVPPAAIDAVAGSVASLTLPFPFMRHNGTYEVQETHPALDLKGDEGVALRQPIRLRELTQAVFAWNAATDQPDLLDVGSLPDRSKLSPPSAIALTTGETAAVNAGDTRIARVSVDITITAQPAARFVDWEYRRNGGDWEPGGSFLAFVPVGSATRRVHIAPADVGSSYQVRARTRGEKSTSDWAISGIIVAAGPTVSLTAPTTTGGIDVGEGQVTVRFGIPNDAAAKGLQLYRSTGTDPAAAAPHGPVEYGAPGTVVAWTITGLPGGVTQHFWARTHGAYGSVSGFSAQRSATPT